MKEVALRHVAGMRGRTDRPEGRREEEPTQNDKTGKRRKVGGQEAAEDWYTWQMYGQKEMMPGGMYRRSYFRCVGPDDDGCPARMVLDQDLRQGPSHCHVAYDQTHQHATSASGPAQLNLATWQTNLSTKKKSLTVPSVPSAPSVSTLPAILSVPKVPTAVPTVPILPTVSTAATVPTVSSVPLVPTVSPHGSTADSVSASVLPQKFQNNFQSAIAAALAAATKTLRGDGGSVDNLWDLSGEKGTALSQHLLRILNSGGNAAVMASMVGPTSPDTSCLTGPVAGISEKVNCFGENGNGVNGINGVNGDNEVRSSSTSSSMEPQGSGGWKKWETAPGGRFPPQLTDQCVRTTDEGDENIYALNEKRDLYHRSAFAPVEPKRLPVSPALLVLQEKRSSTSFVPQESHGSMSSMAFPNHLSNASSLPFLAFSRSSSPRLSPSHEVEEVELQRLTRGNTGAVEVLEEIDYLTSMGKDTFCQTADRTSRPLFGTERTKANRTTDETWNGAFSVSCELRL